MKPVSESKAMKPVVGRIALLALATVLVAGLVISACVSEINRDDEAPVGSVTYTVTTIEGMPCILVNRAYGFGITCNWDEWRGNQ